MKIKCQPGDFRVEELTSRVPGDGPFAFYRLTKTSLGTPEAIRLIARHWQLDPERIAYGGLKDRHAVTSQYLTIEQGPEKTLRLKNLVLEYLGKTDRPYGPQDIQANQFKITVRHLTRRRAERAAEELKLVQGEGFPNYFDQQRFGSISSSGEFVAAAWVKGDYERALWLAIAAPQASDRPRRREEKAYLREHWGNWKACLEQVRSRQTRRVLRFLLEHPQDFRRAMVRIDPFLRRLFLSAFQSAVWNQMLSRHLETECPADSLFQFSVGGARLNCYRQLPAGVLERLRGRSLPLPSARLHQAPESVLQLIEEILARWGLALKKLKLRYPRDTFFSAGERSLVVVPEDLRWGVHQDELYSGKRKLVLSFRLPRGAYATVLIKRVTALEIAKK
jgi:tRNA pseudouridine13 synthase